MNAGNVRLIVACTRRKTVSAGDTVFPHEHDVGNAYCMKSVLAGFLTRCGKQVKFTALTLQSSFSVTVKGPVALLHTV